MTDEDRQAEPHAPQETAAALTAKKKTAAEVACEISARNPRFREREVAGEDRWSAPYQLKPRSALPPIVLQNSEIAAPPIFRQKAKRAPIAIRCTLRPTTGVMGEFIVC